MATTAAQRARSISGEDSPGLVSRKVIPVKWFAALGAGLLVLQAYVYARWLLSGPSRTPHGVDSVPGWMATAARAHEILSVLSMVACVYWFLIRPWRRERTLTLNGMLVLTLPTLYWQDLNANFFNPVYTYNTAFVNFGSWFNFIPGWSSPGGENYPEPIFFELPNTVWAILMPALLFAWAMRRAKSRWPRLGTPGLLLVALAVAATLDLVVEIFWVRLGLYTFAGTIPSLTLFEGHYYQFPIYEPVLIGSWWAAYGALIYFRDDNGNTIAERGIEKICATPRQKTGLRLLALTGVVNLFFLVYNVLFAGISLFPSFRWNADTVNNRSYLRDQLCGPGTTYACPGEDIPIPRVGGAHVDPEGRLVYPPGSSR